MNHNNMDAEQMRKAWIEMGKALGMKTVSGDPDNMNKMNTDLDKLRMYYMKGWEGSIICGIIFSILLLFMPSLKDEYRLPLTVTFAIASSANAYILYWLWKGTGKINPLSMSITQVSTMAKHYKKCHLLYYLIGFPIAIFWIVFFMHATGRSGFNGMEGLVMGAVIGSIGALYGLWKYMSYYRNLTK